MISGTYSHGSAKTIKIYVYVYVLHAHKNKSNIRVLKKTVTLAYGYSLYYSCSLSVGSEFFFI